MSSEKTELSEKYQEVFDGLGALCENIEKVIEEDALSNDERLQLANDLKDLIQDLEKMENDL